MSRKPRGTTSSWILAMEGVAKRLLAQTPASVDLLMSEERSVLEARLLTRNPPLEREAATKLKLSLNQLRSAYKKGLSLLKRVAETREAVENNSTTSRQTARPPSVPWIGARGRSAFYHRKALPPETANSSERRCRKVRPNRGSNAKNREGNPDGFRGELCSVWQFLPLDFRLAEPHPKAYRSPSLKGPPTGVGSGMFPALKRPCFQPFCAGSFRRISTERESNGGSILSFPTEPVHKRSRISYMTRRRASGIPAFAGMTRWECGIRSLDHP